MRFTPYITLLTFVPGFLAQEVTSAEYLASNPDMAVGRAAFDEAREAVIDGDNYMSISRPAESVVVVQQFNGTTDAMLYEVALVNDARAEEYYEKYVKDDSVMEPSKKKCPRAPALAIFERASRCGQFCGRSNDCTADERCPLCAHAPGRCRWQLQCQPRSLLF